ncbi:hypothetical protein PsYK624_119020 [Phanerochaete sordida]|uniref:Uncharacterized protein n=1 Tax=Phanerochaete sordida TaxID=48140 RepID=A0A9P3GJ36_9APHY|nr:hypothetical protein PsYK624_119020 [Phanerochaete sordida]
MSHLDAAQGVMVMVRLRTLRCLPRRRPKTADRREARLLRAELASHESAGCATICGWMTERLSYYQHSCQCAFNGQLQRSAYV